MRELENYNVWIRITVNSYSLLEGTDDFVNELKECYPVQFRKKWYPAACEGSEAIIQFLADTALGSFLTNEGGFEGQVSKPAIKVSENQI